MNRADDKDKDNDTPLQPEQELSNARKQLLRLERAINKNNEMRSKFPNQPAKFIDSEADLDAEIKGLLLLTTNPPLFYPELIKTNTVASLCGLLSHDNIDIAAAAIQVIDELTDDSVLDDQDQSQQDQAAMAALVDALLSAQILELLVSNLSRFNDTPDSDETTQYDADIQAVYHTLSVLENLLSTRPDAAATLVSSTSFLAWSLARIQRPAFDQNKAYAAELLSIALQDSTPNQAALGQAGGIDALLTVLERYRNQDPVDDDEHEFMHNSFHVLCAALGAPENRDRFHAAEGTELMLLLIKAKLRAREGAIQVLDYALASPAPVAAAQALVDAGGLGILFPAFMRKVRYLPLPIPTCLLDSPLSLQTNQHLLAILASLLTCLPSDSAQRIRLLAKFAESAYAKTDRLLQLRATTSDQLLSFLADYVLAWIAMEDDGVSNPQPPPPSSQLTPIQIRAHAHMLLKRSGSSFAHVVDNLKGTLPLPHTFHSTHAHWTPSPPLPCVAEYYHSMETEDGSETETQQIVVGLVNFLLGCDSSNE